MEYICNLSPRQVEYGNDYEEHARHQALLELGRAYAEKYGEEQVRYIYEDMKQDCHVAYDERLIPVPNHLVFLNKEIRYVLE